MSAPAGDERRVRVAIVGGGIAGLSTAHALCTKHGLPEREVAILEASTRIGGNLRTVQKGGFLLDEGPDSWVAMKPHAAALARALGLGDRLVTPLEENRRVYIVRPAARSLRAKIAGGGEVGEVELVPMPEELMLGVPTALMPMVKTPLVSWAGKLRAGLDLVAPEGFGRDEKAVDDESVASFIERRLGKEILDVLVGPLLGGLFGGDAANLSVKATYPQLFALEKKGGLIRGARSGMPKRPRGTPRPPAFQTMRGGVGELVDALGARLGGSVHLRSAVKQVRRVGDHWHVAVDGTAGLLADHVVVAGPAHIGAKLFAETDEVLPGLLAGVPYGSAATVFLAFHVAEIPRKLDATGYLVPASLGRPAAAATWVSSKWPSRAPDGHALVRVFFGKSRVDDDDAQLIDLARVELRQTLGVMAEPELAHVARFREASPSPRVGHVELMAKLRARAAERGGLHFAGSSFDGTGISDCVRQGEAIAAAITGPAATAGSDRPATVR